MLPVMCPLCDTIYLGHKCPKCNDKQNEPSGSDIPDFLKNLFGRWSK